MNCCEVSPWSRLQSIAFTVFRAPGVTVNSHQPPGSFLYFVINLSCLKVYGRFRNRIYLASNPLFELFRPKGVESFLGKLFPGEKATLHTVGEPSQMT